MATNHDTPFAAYFPLPFRVLFLAGVGIWGWAANMHGLDVLGIDAATALDLRSSASSRNTLPVTRTPGFRLISQDKAPWTSLYRLSILYSSWCFIVWVLFRLASRESVLLVDVFRYVPAVAGLGVLTVLFCPFDVLYMQERESFLQAISRCLNPEHIYFSDVIFADIFTSFAKVMGDVWLSVYMLLPQSSLLILPPQTGLSRWIIPTIMSFPYVIRFRQCMKEHAQERGASRKPFYNAIKYASSFPVIYLSAALRRPEEDFDGPPTGHVVLFWLWLLAGAVNTLYSFWWDLTNDWGFDLLKIRSSSGTVPSARTPPQTLHLASKTDDNSLSGASTPLSSVSQSTSFDMLSSVEHAPRKKITSPFGLRDTLLYPLPMYPIIIFLNLILRFTWSIKLSAHLHAYAKEGSIVIFWLEIAELVRRWLWVFLRVEWEVIKQRRDGRAEEEFELMDDLDLGSGVFAK